jgi:hypothetical protein
MTEKAKQLGSESIHAYFGDKETASNGLTKREHFAAIAIQGMLCGAVSISNLPEIEDVAKASCMYADALLEELSKTE